tara:strand:+ start:7355 stop:7903 length:549 start_codon:yes stop_codon:yes gene_type:complete
MIKKGDFLISTPEILGDYYFNRSIITITEVSESEVVGFIVNKELDYSLSDIDDTILNDEIRIFSGGPVNQDNLYFIHKKSDLILNGINFYKNLFWGGEFKKTIELIKNKKIDKGSIKFFSGYSGWTYDQLIEEIKSGSWVVQDGKSNNIFREDSNKMWGENMKKMDKEFQIWSNAPENPQDN